MKSTPHLITRDRDPRRTDQCNLHTHVIANKNKSPIEKRVQVSDLDTRACETLSSRPRSLQQSTAAWRRALRSRLTSVPTSTSAVHPYHTNLVATEANTAACRPTQQTGLPGGRRIRPQRRPIWQGGSKRGTAGPPAAARGADTSNLNIDATLMQPKRRMLQPDESCNNDFGWWGGNSGSDSCRRLRGGGRT